MSGLGVSVDLECNRMPEQVSELVHLFDVADCTTRLFYLASELRIPVAFAVVEGLLGADYPILCGGAAAGYSFSEAAVSALYEVAQSRCVAIAGAREDLIRKGVDSREITRERGYLRPELPPTLAGMPSVSLTDDQWLVPTIESALEVLIRSTKMRHLSSVELSKRSITSPAVVRLIADGLALGAGHYRSTSLLPQRLLARTPWA